MVMGLYIGGSMDIFEVRHKAHGVSLAMMEGSLGGNNSDNVYVTVPGFISPRDRQGLGPLIFEAFPILVVLEACWPGSSPWRVEDLEAQSVGRCETPRPSRD